MSTMPSATNWASLLFATEDYLTVGTTSEVTDQDPPSFTSDSTEDEAARLQLFMVEQRGKSTALAVSVYQEFADLGIHVHLSIRSADGEVVLGQPRLDLLNPTAQLAVEVIDTFREFV